MKHSFCISKKTQIYISILTYIVNFLNISLLVFKSDLDLIGLKMGK